MTCLHRVQAAGGPGSDYAVVSLVRERGTVTVSHVCEICVLMLARKEANFDPPEIWGSENDAKIGRVRDAKKRRGFLLNCSRPAP